MQIRTYQQSDESAVISLWNDVLPDSAPHNDPATAIRNKLAVDGDLFLVAEIDETIVGSVMGGYDGHRGWIYSLAVLPEHRSRGIGADLVRRMEALLKDRGCMKVNLQVRSTNTGVIAFYEKLGYGTEERVSMGKRLHAD